MQIPASRVVVLHLVSRRLQTFPDRGVILLNIQLLAVKKLWTPGSWERNEAPVYLACSPPETRDRSQFVCEVSRVLIRCTTLQST